MSDADGSARPLLLDAPRAPAEVPRGALVPPAVLAPPGESTEPTTIVPSDAEASIPRAVGPTKHKRGITLSGPAGVSVIAQRSRLIFTLVRLRVLKRATAEKTVDVFTRHSNARILNVFACALTALGTLCCCYFLTAWGTPAFISSVWIQALILVPILVVKLVMFLSLVIISTSSPLLAILWSSLQFWLLLLDAFILVVNLGMLLPSTADSVLVKAFAIVWTVVIAVEVPMVDAVFPTPHIPPFLAANVAGWCMSVHIFFLCILRVGYFSTDATVRLAIGPDTAAALSWNPVGSILSTVILSFLFSTKNLLGQITNRGRQVIVIRRPFQLTTFDFGPHEQNTRQNPSSSMEISSSEARSAEIEVELSSIPLLSKSASALVSPCSTFFFLFVDPVDFAAWEDYCTVVPTPICLSMITDRLKNGFYRRPEVTIIHAVFC
jgi:hypothetical protein